MGLELRHITRIETTFSFFNTDGDHGQSAITTDGDDWVYHNDDKSRLYVAARQYYYDGTNHYLDNSFGQVTLHDELLVEDYIRLRTNTTNYLKFLSGSITTVIGGVDAITVDVDDVKIETYVTLSSGESVNDITATIVEPGDNSTICTEKAIVDYITSGAGFWVRQTGTVNRVEPKTIGDHVTLGESIEPSSREWLSINCVNDWDGMGFTPFADTHVNAIRFSNTTSLRCEVGYNHNDDYFFVNTNSVRQFSISYAGDIQLKTGAMVNDITAIINEPGDDTTICTEKSIVDYVASESFWSRDVPDGFLYPKTTTDFVTVGSSTINPDDYYAQILLYHSASAGICLLSNSTDGYSDVLMSDTPGVLSGFVSYYHGDDTMSIATAGSNTLVLDANHYVSTNTIRFQANIIYEYETDGNGDLFVNYYGYAGGTTQFRDTHICDGKNNTIAWFDGSAGSVGIGTSTITGKVHIVNTIDQDILRLHGTGSGHNLIRFMQDSTTIGGLRANATHGMYLYSEGSYPIKLWASGGSGNPGLTVNSSNFISAYYGTYINEFSTDGGLSGNSDNALPTEKAVKTYVDGKGHYWTRHVGGYLYPTITGDTLGIGTSTAPYTYGYDLLVYYNGSTAIGIVSSSTGTGKLNFGDGTSTAEKGFVHYDHSYDTLAFGADGDTKMKINKFGYIYIGAAASEPTDPIEIHSFSTHSVHLLDAEYNGTVSTETTRGYLECSVNGNTVHLIFYQPPI